MRINWCYRVFSNHYLYNSNKERNEYDIPEKKTSLFF